MGLTTLALMHIVAELGKLLDRRTADDAPVAVAAGA